MRLAWGLLAGVTGTLGAGGALAAPHTIVVRNEAGQPVHPAAVSVFVDGTPARAAKGAQGQMAQRDKAFAPTLLVVQTGTPVSFPNFDTVRHHVYSFSPTKPFELKLYAGTPVAPVVFDRAGTATLGCNIHDRMLGYIHVVETPYFGQTDGQGRVVLDLPEGHHRLKVWTPTMGEKHPGLPFPIDPRTRTTRVTLPP
ncbi:methylamine utilization protein [Aquabacterium sp.]|uniref:methylamine utilization protein n=1 Tax=Aquabacterium sp. TaxID=1872578 RepID=UPI003CFD970D